MACYHACMTTIPKTAGPDQNIWQSTDPLGEILHNLRMTGVVYTRSHLTAPWGISLPAMSGCLLFHVVTSGRCILEVKDHPPLVLSPGEFALVPHGLGHRIVHKPRAKAKNFFDLPVEKVSPRYEILAYGGGGEATTLICGAVRFEHPAAQDLVDLLPPIVHIQTWGASHTQWMHSSLQLMAAEATGKQPGGETIVTRLADILVIQAIRTWLMQNPDARTGWLGALQDERIGPAMLLIHNQPMTNWTVASLAKEVAMSRSAFSARFTQHVGQSPVQYLTRWRMHLAGTWLTEENISVAQCTDRLGYESEAAFSRAFKRVTGIAPGAWCKGQRPQNIVDESD